MRTIEKGSGVRCLHAARAGAPVSGFVWPPQEEGCVDSVRSELIAEQGSLCAYCMQRIKTHGYRDGRPGDGGMKVEHWLDRATAPGRMYDWDNLLGVCGGEFADPNGMVRHCDASRGATRLHIHPAGGTALRPEDELEFKRRPPGQQARPYPGVWVHGRTEEARRDIEVLNLNAEHLVRNRRSAVEAVSRRLLQADSKGRIRRSLRIIWNEATGDGALPPFARVVQEYVQKQMRRRRMTP